MKTSQGPSKEEILEELLSPPAATPAEIQILASPFRFGSERSAEALAIDSVGRLTLVFLGQKDEDPWLLSLLDALAWMERHRTLLVTKFHLQTKLSSQSTRLLLAAPDFSKEFLTRLESVAAAKVDAFEWEAVDLAGERKLVFRRAAWRESKISAGQFPHWALDAQGAALFREAVEKITKIDPEIALDWGPGSLDLRFRARLLGSLFPCSEGLRVRIPGHAETGGAVADRAQLTRALDLLFREYVGSDLAISAAQAVNGEASSKKIRDQAPALGRTSLSREELEAIAK